MGSVPPASRWRGSADHGGGACRCSSCGRSFRCGAWFGPGCRQSGRPLHPDGQSSSARGSDAEPARRGERSPRRASDGRWTRRRYCRRPCRPGAGRGAVRPGRSPRLFRAARSATWTRSPSGDAAQVGEVVHGARGQRQTALIDKRQGAPVCSLVVVTHFQQPSGAPRLRPLSTARRQRFHGHSRVVNRPSGCFRSQARSASLISFPRNGSSLLFTPTSTPSTSPTCRALTGPAALPHDGENALVVRRKHGLLHMRRTVRGDHHRPAARLPRGRREHCPFLGDLLAHPFQDLPSNGELIALRPDLYQLLGQLLFELIQFRTPRGDPLQQLGIQHAPDRR